MANKSYTSVVNYRANYVFPVAQSPIMDGVVSVQGGKVVGVGSRGEGKVVDLGQVALLPGLVNAHTHLEFSDCRNPFPAGATFPDWIRQVVAFRRNQSNRPADPWAMGLAESLKCGTTLLGEIASVGWNPAAFETSPVRSVVFLEMLGLAEEQVEKNLAAAEGHGGETAERWTAGLSPHAPYSVHPELFRRTMEMAGKRKLPVAMHVAETREELELLDRGTGPFREMLEQFGIWSEGIFQRGQRPLDFLKPLAKARRALVVHGNYLDGKELAWLADQPQMSVVSCPRTHQHFGHEEHPLPRLMAAGVRVALGTDSRASNPDLSLLEELRTVARLFPQLRPSSLLRLATQAGADALGLGHLAGQLSACRPADMIAVPIENRHPTDPHDLRFGSSLPVSHVMKNGQWVITPDEA